MVIHQPLLREFHESLKVELTQEQELEQIPDRPSKLFWIHNKCLIDEEDSEIVSDNDNGD